MKEGSSTTSLSNLISVLVRLVSVGIKFEDEVEALLLLSSLPQSLSGTVQQLLVQPASSLLSGLEI
jgi:hypothetical protein